MGHKDMNTSQTSDIMSDAFIHILWGKISSKVAKQPSWIVIIR